ncbi:MAG: hypothetical protein ACM3KE_19215 [Hyphomicrobiales bacterium]
MASRHTTLGSRQSITAILLGLVVAWTPFGCTTIKDTAKGTVRTVSESSRKVADAITPGGAGIKRKLTLIGIETRPETGQADFGAHFSQTMSDYLQNECKEALLDEAVGAILRSPPRLASGQIDGYSLAMMGRPRGINYFVIGSLTDVRFLDEKTGFWLWKKTRYRIRATLRVEIVDSAEGAKSLDETFWDEMVIDETAYETLKEAGAIPLTEILPVLARLLREAGYKTCATLRNQPWQGFITAADQNRLTISAGSAVGLSPGKGLEVFDRGRVVEGKDGRRFLKPGDKIGEARIESVSADQAEAVLSQPAAVAAGGTVQLK